MTLKHAGLCCTAARNNGLLARLGMTGRLAPAPPHGLLATTGTFIVVLSIGGIDRACETFNDFWQETGAVLRRRQAEPAQ